VGAGIGIGVGVGVGVGRRELSLIPPDPHESHRIRTDPPHPPDSPRSALIQLQHGPRGLQLLTVFVEVDLAMWEVN
jgi:hypothetical protein